MGISVYITSYNQKTYLIDAIDSVLAQTLKAHQIVIVDDGSQDTSQEVIKGYQSQYPELITALFHQQNQGIAKTRIDALEAIKEQFVSYVDGDDRFLPSKLEKEMKILEENPDVDIAFSNSFYINEEGKRIGKWIINHPPPEGNVFSQTFARDYPRRNLFRMELISYDAWKKAGFHDPRLYLLEDWEMRTRLSKHYRTIYYNEPLSEIRVHKYGLSKTPAVKKLEALDYIWNKNKVLLVDLDESEQVYVKKKIHEWKAKFIRMMAKEELIRENQLSGDRRLAFRFYFQSLKYHLYPDFELFLGFILPRAVYHHLRSSYLNRKIP